MSHTTERGQYWCVHPGYDTKHIAFGFGDLRPDYLGPEFGELVLHGVTPAEARAIAAALLAAAADIEARNP